MSVKTAVIGLCLLPLLGAAACGPRYDDAEKLESQGRLLQAAREYRDFAFRRPSSPYAPEALRKAARIYAVDLNLCYESKPLLERLARDYPGYKMPEDSFRSIFICPDYFPAGPGRVWKYGDSQTLGRNARQVAEVTGETSRGTTIRNSFYAGSQLVSAQSKTYRFSGTDFMERQGRTDTLILDYPLEKGKTWRSRGPEGTLTFRVEDAGLTVKVAAGLFTDCVKISRRPAGLPSWIDEYYAPWVGKILTSVAGKGFENRVTELLSYEEKK
jgi:hypothetical protein